MKKELIIQNNSGNIEKWTRVDRNRGKGFSSWTNGYETKHIHYTDVDKIQTRSDLERADQKWKN